MNPKRSLPIQPADEATRRTILLIEDEPDTLAILALMLEMEGYESLAAANASTGLELARRHRPDLILCDVSMPGIDGYAVLKAVRSSPDTAAIPFIFLSASCERGDIQRGIANGADAYISKPADCDEILATIRVWLDHCREPGQKH